MAEGPLSAPKLVEPPSGTAQSILRPQPDPYALKATEPFTDDDNIDGYVDGSGNRTWLPDTSASAKAIVFVAPSESTDFEFMVKWVKGANGLKISAADGSNVGGTTTFSCQAAGDSYEFRSDGTQYNLVGRVGDFISSASLASQLSGGNFSPVFNNLTVLGSATFSQTVAFLTSINVSGTMSVNTLVVAGTASFSATVVFGGEVRALGTLAVSATASVGALTVGGLPLTGLWEKITTTAVSNVINAAVSGSWTAYSRFQAMYQYKASAAGGSNSVALFFYVSTDNGATRHLQGFDSGDTAGASSSFGAFAYAEIMGNGTTMNSQKYLLGMSTIEMGGTGGAGITSPGAPASTQTANSGVINEIGFGPFTLNGVSKTLSSGFLTLYGLRGS